MSDVQFTCEGCGVQVFAFGVDCIPRHQLCSVCAWLCEFADEPAVFDNLYRRMCQHAKGDAR